MIAVDAWYEWARAGDLKIPHALGRDDRSPVVLGGIWECWRSPIGDRTLTLAIVTTPAMAELATIHERMPLVLDEADWPAWLGEVDGDPIPLMRPAPAGSIAAWRVGGLDARSATRGTTARSCWQRPPDGSRLHLVSFGPVAVQSRSAPSPGPSAAVRPMAHHFREPERRQEALLSADMMEWMPEGALLIVAAAGMMLPSSGRAIGLAAPGMCPQIWLHWKTAGLSRLAKAAVIMLPLALAATRSPWSRRMFAVDEAAAAAIRRVFNEEGELSAIVELRRRFPGVAPGSKARECVRIIAGWTPPPEPADRVVPLQPRRPSPPGRRIR